MKNKKPFTVFSAALVAVCMVLQLTPVFGSIPAAQAAVGDTFELNFVSQVWVSGDGGHYRWPTQATIDNQGWELDYENTTVDMNNTANQTGMYSGTFVTFDSNNQTVAFKFKAPEDGTYSLSSTSLNNWKNTEKCNISVNGVEIGTADFYNGDSSDTTSTIEQSYPNTVDLKANWEYSIAFTIQDYSSDWHYKMHLNTVTFTKTADLITGPVIEFDGLTTDTIKTKKITADSPWELDTAKTTAASPTVYTTTLADGSTAASYLASTHSNTKHDDGSWTFQTLSFKIKIEEDGLYDLSAVTYLIGSEWNRADQIEIQIDGAAVHTGTLSSKVKDGDTANTLKTYTLNQVAMKKGYHNIAITDEHGSSDKYSLTLNSLVFNRVGDITAVTPAAVSDNFGENYAYVRESYVAGTKVYNVIFLGGINTITGYAKVGFEYSTDGGATWTSAMSDKVYESLEFSDDNLTNSEFGTDYIFYSDVEFTGVNASSAVTFRACAVTESGAKVYGDEFTVPVNK